MAETPAANRGRRRGDPPVAGALTLATHPAAAAGIRRAKGWGGLVCFALALVLSWRGGVPPADAALRALLAGVAGYLGAWACAVAVWRQLVVAQMRARRPPPES